MAQASGTGRGQVRCQYHPDAHLAEDYRAGDMICTECGLVVGDRVIDVGRYVNLQFTCIQLFRIPMYINGLFQRMENILK